MYVNVLDQAPHAQDEFHNYTIDWTPERIRFIINSQVVREVPYAPPSLYPQTPSRVQFGLWCAGCSKEPGVVAWAGGKPDWDQGPFLMSVKSIRVVDGTQNATQYTYTDHSGDYKSIQIDHGESEAYKMIHDLNYWQKAGKNWGELSQTAKIAIASSVLGVFGILACVFFIYCFKQRKAGKVEAAMQEKAWREQHDELMSYRSMMAQGTFAVSRDSIINDQKPFRK